MHSQGVRYRLEGDRTNRFRIDGNCGAQGAPCARCYLLNYTRTYHAPDMCAYVYRDGATLRNMRTRVMFEFCGLLFLFFVLAQSHDEATSTTNSFRPMQK